MSILDEVKAVAPKEFEIVSAYVTDADEHVVEAIWKPGNARFKFAFSSREYRLNKGKKFDALIRHRLNNGYRTRMLA